MKKFSRKNISIKKRQNKKTTNTKNQEENLVENIGLKLHGNILWVKKERK
jgi:hypothetical protein